MSAALWRASRLKLLVFALVATYVIAASLAPVLGFSVADRRPATRSDAPGSPDALLSAHGCWTRSAPADMKGKVPGRVVVTLPDGRTVYGGTHLVTKALDQVFAGTDHGLTVHGFCR